MPWTENARRQYRRESARYASDLTDLEWALIEPFIRKTCNDRKDYARRYRESRNRLRIV